MGFLFYGTHCIYRICVCDPKGGIRTPVTAPPPPVRAWFRNLKSQFAMSSYEIGEFQSMHPTQFTEKWQFTSGNVRLTLFKQKR